MLGYRYSYSDIFDIVPEIERIGKEEKDKKEIIYVSHCKDNAIKVEDLGKDNKFKNFEGKILECNTDVFIKELWKSFSREIGRYKEEKYDIEWKERIEKWIKEEVDRYNRRNLIVGSIFQKIGDLERTIKYYEEAKNTLKQNSDWVECLTRLGFVYGESGKYKEAIRCFKDAIKSTNRDIVKIRCYRDLGRAYYYMGRTSLAIRVLKKALKKAEHDQNQQGWCYLSLGTVLCNLGNPIDKIIEDYYNKALEIAKKNGDKMMESTCYMKIGYAYKLKEDIGKCLEYYKKALNIAREIGDRRRECAALVNLGEAYCKLRKFKEARDRFEKALEIALGKFKKAQDYFEDVLKVSETDITDKYLTRMIRALNGLGFAYCGLDQLEKAIEYHNTAKKIAKRNNIKEELINTYRGLANAYRKQREFEKSIRYLKKALRISKRIKHRIAEAKVNVDLGNVYTEALIEHKAKIHFKKALKMTAKMG